MNTLRPTLLSTALAILLLGCEEKTSDGPTAASNPSSSEISGRIIDVNGKAIPGLEITVAGSLRKATTDSLGAWTLSVPSPSPMDSMVVSSDGIWVATLPLFGSHESYRLVRLLGRKVLGQLDTNEFVIYGTPFIPPTNRYRIRVVVDRQSGHRTIHPALYDPSTMRYSCLFWTLDGTSSTDMAWAEVVDSIGPASRSQVVKFDSETGDLRIVPMRSSNLVVSLLPSIPTSEWRSRDTSRVSLGIFDTSLVGEILWKTSKDTIWKAGGTSLLVRCPSVYEPILTVQAKVTTKEGRISLSTPYQFTEGYPPYGFYGRPRHPTPPRLDPTFPDSAAIGDSVWISFGATDTLGGKVVRRYLYWNWQERLDFEGDSMKVLLPDRRSEISFGGTLVAVDDEGDTAMRYIRFRMIPPAPSMEIKNLPSGGIHVGWQRPWKGNVTAFHLKFLDSTAGILLLDTVIHDTAVRSFDLPRFFFSRTVHIMGRYQEWWGEEHSAWAVHVDTLNSTPVNPIHVKTGTWTYRSHIYEPNQSSYSNCGLANNLPLIPTTDSGAVLCYQPQPIGVEFSYALALQILSPLHVSDSVVVDILTQDSVSLQVRLGSLSIDTQSVWLGWMPRTAGSGKHVFRLSDLRIYAQDDNMIDSPVLLPTGWHGLGESQILKEARKASRLDIVAPCAIQDGKCKDIPGGLVQLKTIQTF